MQPAEALRLSEERFRNLFERSPMSIWEEDFTAVAGWFDERRAEGVEDLAAYLAEYPGELHRVAEMVVVKDVNQATVDMFGARSKEDFMANLGKTFTDRSYQAFAAGLDALWRGRRIFEIDGEARTLGGETFYQSVRVVVPESRGRPDWSNVLVVLVDVTARRLAEEKLRASLREKDTLLQELHHRVKNNLQIVSSLLYLQSQHSSEQDPRELFAKARQRIESMSLVHELLYRSDDLVSVDFATYLRRLTLALTSFYRDCHQTRQVAIEVRAMDAPFDLNRAIPCGLIVNELVTNSLKHAFPSGPGRVRIGFSRSAAGDAWVLTVADDGVGLREDALQEPVTLGLQLVRALVSQLDGRLEVRRDKERRGTTFEIRFAA
jgi:two-component sensor histidine kinase